MKSFQNLLLETRQKGLRYTLHYSAHLLARRMGVLTFTYPAQPLSNTEFQSHLNEPLTAPTHPTPWFFTQADCDQYQHAAKTLLDEAARQKLLEQADAACKGSIQPFGGAYYSWGQPIDWFFDPQSGKRWPSQGHWSRLGLFGPALGDIKFVWRLNSHFYFLPLARAYWLTGDKKYARAVITQLNDWMQANPRETGINWHNSHEIALRLINWLWSYHFLGKLPEWQTIQTDFLKTVYAFCYHLERDMSFTQACIRNDHLVSQSLALYMAGLSFPEFKQSCRWMELAEHYLLTEARFQFMEDGVYMMHSVSYQRNVTYLYLMYWRLCIVQGRQPHADIQTAVEKSLKFLAAVALPAGRPPFFGEGDGTHVFQLAEVDYWDFRPLLHLGSLLVEHPFLGQTDYLSEEAYWCLGADYLTERAKSSPTAELTTGSQAFTAGGYYLMRHQNQKMLIHCGHRETHWAHASALHLDLTLEGQNVLCDAGTYLYNGPKIWRDYFKGTRSHNTLVVDGQEQMINHRKFTWLAPVKGRLHGWQVTEPYDYFWGEHNGYQRLPGHVTHQRAVFFAKQAGYWIIFDFISGQGEHHLELNYHLPGSSYQFKPEAAWLSVPITGQEQGQLSLFVPNSPLETKIYQGETDPIRGWRSRFYGEKEPGLCLSQSGKVNLPHSLVTVISLTPGHEQPCLSVTRFQPESCPAVETPAVQIEGVAYNSICVQNFGQNKLVFQHRQLHETVPNVLFARWTTAGELRDLFLI